MGVMEDAKRPRQSCMGDGKTYEVWTLGHTQRRICCGGSRRSKKDNGRDINDEDGLMEHAG